MKNKGGNDSISFMEKNMINQCYCLCHKTTCQGKRSLTLEPVFILIFAEKKYQSEHNLLYFCHISVVNCGNPGNVNNADKTGTTYTYQSQVSYSCRSGYERTSGSPTRTCLASGDWDGTAPVCYGEHVLLF